jgi:hypothetical protein
MLLKKILKLHLSLIDIIQCMQLQDAISQTQQSELGTHRNQTN